MKKIDTYILEKLHINKDVKDPYNYHPKTKEELIKILKECLAKDKNADLNDIDVSEITNMSSLFDDLDPCNIDISKWDVGNVKNMNCMFYTCDDFNCNLSNWDVSNVKDMSYMFAFCHKLDCNLQNWKLRKHCITTYMFHQCDNMTIPTWYKK